MRQEVSLKTHTKNKIYGKTCELLSDDDTAMSLAAAYISKANARRERSDPDYLGEVCFHRPLLTQ